MLDYVVVEKAVFEGRVKAKEILTNQLHGRKNPIPGMIGEDLEYDEGTDVDDPLGQGERRYLGEAQEPTVPLEEGPNPFPMLDAPLG